jgi:hypothetical protein
MAATPGDQREDQAAASAAAVAAIYAQAELVIIAAVSSLTRKAVTGALLPGLAAMRLQRTIAAVFAGIRPRVEAELSQAAADLGAGTGGAGVSAAEALAPLAEAIEAAEDTAQQAVAEVLSDAVAAADAVTAPGRLAITAGPERLAITGPKRRPSVFRDASDAYRYAVQGAIEDTRGGMPGTSLSLSRIQAAQKALDDLADHGITGFTDRTGRRWDLASYVEMATRTAVSNSWDDLQTATAVRSGLDLIETYTHSSEGSCKLCLPWLGRKLSLTGATEGYATLSEAKAAGFRHPSCRCSWIVIGSGVMTEVASAVPDARAAAVYKASQRQRALERRVRLAGRRAQAAITPQARTAARRELRAARSASEHHRHTTGLVMTKVGVARREHPVNAR